jgi:predicted thioredoxin/glutaredoxin
MKDIKVIGVKTCSNCSKLTETIEKLINENGLNAKVEKITDPMEFMKHKILSPPGIVINGNLVHSGGVPKNDDLKKILGL